MNRSQHWQGVPALIELLLETAETCHRDRILLEAVASQTWAEAVALWRPGSDGPEFGARWNQVLSRGPAERLPERDAVEAVVRGECSNDLFPGLRILQAGSGRGAFALAVACADVPEDEVDLLEALLCLFAVFDVEDGTEHDALETWVPLLPADEDSRIEHDLRNLLTGIQTTQELLGLHGDELSEEERGHFSEMLDRECARAGDLLGHALGGPHTSTDEPGRCHPAQLLIELVAELGADGGAELHLALDARARAIESGLDAAPLRELLRDLLAELRAGSERVHLSVESTGDDDAPLMLRLLGVDETPNRTSAEGAEDRISALQDALEGRGIRAERDGTR